MCLYSILNVIFAWFICFKWSKWWLIVKIPSSWVQHWGNWPPECPCSELPPVVQHLILKNYAYIQYQMWFFGWFKCFKRSKWWVIVKISLSLSKNRVIDPRGCPCNELPLGVHHLILKNYAYIQYQMFLFMFYVIEGDKLVIYCQNTPIYNKRSDIWPPGVTIYIITRWGYYIFF